MKFKYSIAGSVVSLILYIIGVYISNIKIERGEELVYVYVFLLVSALLGAIIGAAIDSD